MKFTASRYVEKRYDFFIEAENEAEAAKMVKSLTDDDWGDHPELTIGDETILFNETGDELDRW